MIPKAPPVPTNNCLRSSPVLFLRKGASSCTTVPSSSASTTSIPSRLWRTSPCLSKRLPPALAPINPPIAGSLPISIGKYSEWVSSVRFSSDKSVPASTITVRFKGSISRTWRMRVRETITCLPELSVTAPPTNPLRLPWAISRMRWRTAMRISALTAWASRGKTTAAALPRHCATSIS